MLNILRKDYGEYVKGFFQINLNIKLEDGFQIDKLDTEDFATFVHEYVHFLQNISTTHGVTYFNDISKLIQLYVYEADKCEETIVYPVSLEECDVENAYEENELQSFYIGTEIQKKVHHVNDIRIEKEDLLKKIAPKEVRQSVNIYYDDKEIPYVFGTHCIEESMAYLIESEKFSGICRKNELPYNSCELVCEKFCPELLEQKGIIVALAEMSLMHFNSGVLFVKLLEKISKEKIKFKDTDDVARILRGNIGYSFENYKSAYEDSEDAINFLYPLKNPAFENVNIWLKKILKKGFDLRNIKCNFISKMMDLSPEESKEYFKCLTITFGFPIICDSNDNIYSLGNNIATGLVAIAIFQAFTSGTSQCYLYKYCKAEKLSAMNENCKYSPWSQSKEERLCPFAAFWYYYSLDGKVIGK